MLISTSHLIIQVLYLSYTGSKKSLSDWNGVITDIFGQEF